MSETSPFEVCPYSIETLKKLLSDKSKAPSDVIADKRQMDYFQEYFKYLGASTIVAESDYVDRDFLEDYAGYYVRCFQPYPARCVRLHFFSVEFSDKEFEAYLAGVSGPLTAELLQDKNIYLGFMVVKPLPKTVFGRTCLTTYDEDGGRRHYPIKREYQANLFGTPLTVNTLAFQEQDRVAAACATSALWSALHGTGVLFHHRIPAPVEITRAAVGEHPLRFQTVPNNRALTKDQMVRAMQYVGLEPSATRVTRPYVLESTLYAYLKGKIPVPLVLYLIGMREGEIGAEVIGQHAVTATGFSLGLEKPASSGEYGFLLEATRMDEVYAHDDQVGPFARMKFVHIALPDEIVQKLPQSFCLLSTSWRTEQFQAGNVYACPDTALLPLHGEIRVPLEAVLNAVTEFDGFIKEMVKADVALVLTRDIVWDVFLSSSNDFKDSVRDSPLRGEYARTLLVENMPRYVWRAVMTSAGTSVLELLYDTTDFKEGRIFIRAVEYDQILSVLLRAAARVEPMRNSTRSGARAALSWFAKQPLQAETLSPVA